MAIRNFWQETVVAGRKTKVSAGPQAADGGMTTRLYVRDHGNSRLALEIVAYCDIDGETLIIHVDSRIQAASQHNSGFSLRLTR